MGDIVVKKEEIEYLRLTHSQFSQGQDASPLGRKLIVNKNGLPPIVFDHADSREIFKQERDHQGHTGGVSTSGYGGIRYSLFSGHNPIILGGADIFHERTSGPFLK